jgi:hypothetical protein
MKASFNTAIRENTDLFVEAKIDETTVQRMCGGSFVGEFIPASIPFCVMAECIAA